MVWSMVVACEASEGEDDDVGEGGGIEIWMLGSEEE